MENTSVITKWAIDASHSELNFRVKHLMISTVSGTFRSFTCAVATDGNNFDGATVTFEADVNSITTNNTDRDNHLKSDDFFASETYPKMSFVGKLINDGDEYVLKGDLTIRGISRPVEMEAEFNGIAKDPWGNTKAGFELKGKINRKDFGLTWNVATETGGVLVSEEVKLKANIQLLMM